MSSADNNDVIWLGGDAIRLFPAWPREWDVRLTLHAPFNTTVEGELKDGRLHSLKTTPGIRKAVVINMIEKN